MHGGQKSSMTLEKPEIYATITVVYLSIEESESELYIATDCVSSEKFKCKMKRRKQRIG